uniref:sensor histidine kinase n=1 Tax=Pelomonas sp. KK5 TaxID=1855730 RepID=UPI001180C286
IRYTPAGGRIDLGAALEGGRVVVVVSDTGPGIAPAERARVFDPFHRVLGSGESGSGLGLSIVKTIVERIGAGIALAWSDEAAQTGLRVTLWLPT